jgi:hypothetical protein
LRRRVTGPLKRLLGRHARFRRIVEHLSSGGIRLIGGFPQLLLVRPATGGDEERCGQDQESTHRSALRKMVASGNGAAIAQFQQNPRIPPSQERK